MPRRPRRSRPPPKRRRQLPERCAGANVLQNRQQPLLPALHLEVRRGARKARFCGAGVRSRPCSNPLVRGAPMPHQSESEMESTTARSFEHALDDLYGLATQPPTGFGVIDEPWADAPTQMLPASYESGGLDAVALFEGVQVGAPSAAAREIGLLAEIASPMVAPTSARRDAPTMQIRPPAPQLSNESLIMIIAIGGAAALVAIFMAWSH